MERSPSGITLSLHEAAELISAASVVEKDFVPDERAMEEIGRQVDIRIEHPELESVPIPLDRTQVKALYVVSRQLAVMGLYSIHAELRKQHRSMLLRLGAAWDDGADLRCREDAEDYFVTAHKFKALVETPENA